MIQVKLRYRGKKKPFKTPPIVKSRITFGDEAEWMPEHDADILMRLNPKMFQRMDSREVEDPKDPADEMKDINQTWYCGKCGKPYTVERYWVSHEAKCTGPKVTAKPEKSVDEDDEPVAPGISPDLAEDAVEVREQDIAPVED